MSTEIRDLSYFQGHWDLHRRITQSTGDVAFLTGQATWRAEGDDLICDEVGEMHLPGHAPLTSRQRTIWHPGLRVSFADGRAFHRVPERGGRATHWCDPDQYVARYHFVKYDVFTVCWRVAGPRKSYRMISVYRRSPNC